MMISSIKQKAKNFLKRLVYKEKASSATYVNYLRSKGCQIGENTRFFDPMGTEIDITKPELIHIGKNVQITAGCKIVTHGFDWYVLNGVYGDIMGSAGEVNIGNNVFLGMNTIILKGVSIGNNVIVGAGSLVNKDIPDNVVAAGNPVRIIDNLDNYYSKRLSLQKDEAYILYKNYVKAHNNKPDKSYFHEFFWLFETESEGVFDVDKFNYEMNIGGRYDNTLKRYKETKRMFANYTEFCEYCENRIDAEAHLV